MAVQAITGSSTGGTTRQQGPLGGVGVSQGGHRRAVAVSPRDRNNMIELQDIVKTYQMGQIQVRVLQGLTCSIERGEMVAIMGPSGSGKSTLMNIIGCLDTPTSGSYILDGARVSELSDSQLAEVRNKKIGFVFQTFRPRLSLNRGHLRPDRGRLRLDRARLRLDRGHRSPDCRLPEARVASLAEEDL